jgi:hypothetical protein
VYSLKNFGGSVLGDDADDLPAPLRDLRQTALILDVLGPVSAVLVAVILDRELNIAPSHIEVREGHTLVKNRDLRLWYWKAVVNQQES